MRPREIYYSRWKAKSRQTKAEMARSGEIAYMARNQMKTEMARQNTLACHDLSRHTTKCKKVRHIFSDIGLHG